MTFSFDDFFAVFRSLLFFLMNDLFRIHSFYMYSLNSFVVIFMRGIDLVSEDKAAGKGKGSLMSRFKKAARKIIQSQRFSWNVDILHTVTAITKGGQGMNMMDIQAKAKASKENSLTDEQVEARCTTLNDSITRSVFNYLRRGLFDKEKLMVATQLVLKIMVQTGAVTVSCFCWFLLVFVGFWWFLLVFVGFCWFCCPIYRPID
jgi:dynein heavy chain